MPAVELREVSKSYNRGKIPVLSELSLRVEQGKIYGLLGPSGCGKTTLLRLVVGRLKVDKGTISIFGHTPGSAKSRVPGDRVGYMPQDLALYNEFTTTNTLFFFGRLFGMSSKRIEERIGFLIDFLNLPPPSRNIGQLSGGQKRRVSFAVALLHCPELLILDEPTVGVDPLLRQKIWSHLLEICRKDNTTIIITTHYIEEARQADIVGLMRSGKILAQDRPDSLLEHYGKDTLEDVFLHLCLQDEQKNLALETESQSVPFADDFNDRDALVVGNNVNNLTTESSNSRSSRSENQKTVTQSSGNSWQGGGVVFSEDVSCSEKCCHFFGLPRLGNIWALVIKNLVVMKSRKPFLVFQFLLPAIQISLFSLCVGGLPTGLDVAFYSADTGLTVPVSLHKNASFNLAQSYMAALNGDTVIKNHYSSVEETRQAVKNGDAWAAVSFGANFSRAFIQRFINPTGVDPLTAQEGSVDISMDMTNQQISLTLQQLFSKSFIEFSAIVNESAHKQGLNISMVSSDLPLIYGPPVYGVSNPSFLDFMAPGVIITIVFFMATGLTALSFVLEKKEGLLERSQVSGVLVSEIMLGHLLTQFLVISVQTAVLLIFALLVFQIYNVGSVLLVIILALLPGLNGMCLGLLISSVAKDEVAATQMSIGLVYPSLLLSGVLWPLEGMNDVLAAISVYMPLTYSAEAMRFILGRGWDLLVIEVWRGYLIPLAWSFSLCVLSAVIIKLKGF